MLPETCFLELGREAAQKILHFWEVYKRAVLYRIRKYTFDITIFFAPAARLFNNWIDLPIGSYMAISFWSFVQRL